jgi:hypothetical protein
MDRNGDRKIERPAIFIIGLVQGFVALFWLRQLGHLRFGEPEHPAART